MKKTLFLALGSNLGEMEKTLDEAKKHLEKNGIIVISESKRYKTKPMYYTEQGFFLNSVVQCSTDKEPVELLKVTQSIEKTLGREKTFQNGPRCIDIDILLYEGININLKDLNIPHLKITERDFVLKPLIDLGVGEKLIRGKTVTQWLKEVDFTTIID